MNVRWTRRAWLTVAAGVLATSAVAVAAPAATATPVAATASGRPGHPHVDPIPGPAPSVDPQRAETPASAPAGAFLQYFGGPVISNVSVHSVYWGTGTYETGAGPGDPQIVGFFTGVTNSPYMDWLGEYSQNGQTIGRGSFHGQTTITPSAANDGLVVDATNVEDELGKQIHSGALPAPATDAGGNVDTLYAMFFPQGTTLTADGGTGGLEGGFCAYHGTIALDGLMVPYMVLPDFDDSLKLYDQGCGGNSSLFNNFTAVTGHEMLEAVTDPAVGLAFSNGPPLAWYDNNNNNGEVADICNQQQGPVRGGNGQTYIVQAGFSNVEGDCVVKAPKGYAAACADASPSAFVDAGLAADCLKLYGIALGKGDGTFGEDDPLRRSQVSSLLARLLTLAGTSLGAPRSFPDVDGMQDTQVRDEIEALAGAGVIAGFPDGLFHPNDNLTLAQAATLVVRTMQLVKGQHAAAPSFSDQGPTATNYHYAFATGLLDTQAADKNGSLYPSDVGNTTNRGLLADMLAQAVQRLRTHSVVSQR